MFTATALAVVTGSFCLGGVAAAQTVLPTPEMPHAEEAQDFVHGRPEKPSEAWIIAAGGRIYDNWWDALDKPEPIYTHPAYPATGVDKGSASWRCKTCHGWDYLGKDGIYSRGSHHTGIEGIDGAIGKPVEEIVALLRAPLHGYNDEMLSDDEIGRVAAFVSRGQIDMRSFIAIPERKLIAGDPAKGAGVFQTVCAACHGFDGKLLDWGEGEGHNYVGTEAAELPDEVMNKILNAHPGVAMVNLRAFPVEVAIDLLAYAATLPTE